MDLVDFSENRFRQIESAYREFARELGIDDVTAIPLSALKGDNCASPSAAMPWYDGPTLLEYLENVEVAATGADDPFRMPVQWVCRPNLDFRGYAGTICSGSVSVGDEIVVAPSGRPSKIARIVTYDGDRDRPCRRCRDADLDRRNRHRPRRRDLAPQPTAPRSPTSSRQISCG